MLHVHQELQELVFQAYMHVADDACTEAREEMNARGCSLPLATAALKSRAGFNVREEHVGTIASLTRRHQSECAKLLDHAFFRLGILQHESLVSLIRMRMKAAFGLELPGDADGKT